MFRTSAFSKPLGGLCCGIASSALPSCFHPGFAFITDRQIFEQVIIERACTCFEAAVVGVFPKRQSAPVAMRERLADPAEPFTRLFLWGWFLPVLQRHYRRSVRRRRRRRQFRYAWPCV